MTTPMQIDAEHLRSCIGRSERSVDVLTLRQCRALRATLGLADGSSAPLSSHWCLAPPIVPASELGDDGHPVRGHFLPPVPLPRRMWVGGVLRILDPLRVGDSVERVTRIADVSLKNGRNGRLCFVQLEHEVFTERGLAIKERQDLVYRSAPIIGAQKPAPAGAPDCASAALQTARTVNVDSVMLFRYSALTFNAHRIHFDRRYATEVEGYPGLVVHAPLQASLLLELVAQELLRRPQWTFEFRAVRPLFEGLITLRLAAGPDRVQLSTCGDDGQPGLTACASW